MHGLSLLVKWRLLHQKQPIFGELGKVPELSDVWRVSADVFHGQLGQSLSSRLNLWVRFSLGPRWGAPIFCYLVFSFAMILNTISPLSSVIPFLVEFKACTWSCCGQRHSDFPKAFTSLWSVKLAYGTILYQLKGGVWNCYSHSSCYFKVIS
jgi:hypothetical protein